MNHNLTNMKTALEIIQDIRHISELEKTALDQGRTDRISLTHDHYL